MVPGGFRVSLLALKAAGELFELEAQIDGVKLTAKREKFRVMPAAHIVQPKVPKPPRRSAGAANRRYTGGWSQRAKQAKSALLRTVGIARPTRPDSK